MASASARVGRRLMRSTPSASPSCATWAEGLFFFAPVHANALSHMQQRLKAARHGVNVPRLAIDTPVAAFVPSERSPRAVKRLGEFEQGSTIAHGSSNLGDEWPALASDISVEITHGNHRPTA